MARQIKQLDELMDGALTERFNREMDRVLQNVRSGSIVLFHNAAIHTPEALPGIIEALQKEGYTIVPVSQLLLQGDTYQDNTGRQWAR